MWPSIMERIGDPCFCHAAFWFFSCVFAGVWTVLWPCYICLGLVTRVEAFFGVMLCSSFQRSDLVVGNLGVVSLGQQKRKGQDAKNRHLGPSGNSGDTKRQQERAMMIEGAFSKEYVRTI